MTDVVKDSYKNEVIDPGDQASKLGREICFNSHQNCPAVTVVPHDSGNFRGPVGFVWNKKILQEMMKFKIGQKGASWSIMEEVENDGAGGKPQFFTLANDPEIFRNLGEELIAMTADDFARSGRFPCIIDNEMQVKRITKENYPLFEAAMTGYGEALKKANLINITGETAIMKHSITAFCDANSDSQLVLTWGASCIGLSSSKLLLDPKKIRPYMPIVGFKENGYRCNGGTFFSNLIIRKYGPEIDKIINNPEAIKFARQLAVPSISYAKTICRILGWQENGEVKKALTRVLGIAHITGGGLWAKFGEILPPGVGASLTNMPDPPEVLLKAQQMSQEFSDLALTDEAAYSTFHGGCGMLLVVDNEYDAESVILQASEDDIEAQVVGYTDTSGKLKIDSKFLMSPGVLLQR
jgi:phosphoribosylaminoimidazole (AIR) synthetase